MVPPELDAKTLEEIKKKLVKVFAPQEIYLRGPYANQAMGEELNIDIIIIVETATMPRYEMMSAAQVALMSIDIPKNILIYTKEEFDDFSEKAWTLSYLVKHEGRKIYAKA